MNCKKLKSRSSVTALAITAIVVGEHLFVGIAEDALMGRLECLWQDWQR